MALIGGVAFRGFRSFPSSSLAIVFPFSKINLVVGQNNTGKSNVLRAVHNALARTQAETSNFDRPAGDAEYLPLTMFPYALHEIAQSPVLQRGDHNQLRNLLERPEFSLGIDGQVWVERGSNGLLSDRYMDAIGPQAQNLAEANTLVRELNNGWSSDTASNVWDVMRIVSQAMPPLPPSVYIESNRAISAESAEEPDLNGRSLKKRLLELQNPSYARLQDRAVFLQIQEFVRTVMDDGTVTIDIPHDLSTIHLTQSGRTLPIENVGTGIHEVVILAAAATVVTDSVVCIEEPEVHIHPVMQRQLLRYLNANTSNQYLIATHSAHLLDSDIASVFHVTLESDGSRVAPALTATSRAAICADLGYRPSDLVQTNAVIWVEGPSDRTYIRAWLEMLAPGRFVEGLHFSIMFYGGSLLSELSPLDREEVEEFISLKNLNRYTAVVIDSDKSRAEAELNDSKRRVIRGIGEDLDTGISWVTAGYTIENYVPAAILDAAIKAAHPRSANTTMQSYGRFRNPLAESRTGVRKPSKTAIAKGVVANWPEDQWPHDLRERMQEIVRFIDRANGHRSTDE